MTNLEGIWALGYLGFGLKAVENFMGRERCPLAMFISSSHTVFLKQRLPWPSGQSRLSGNEDQTFNPQQFCISGFQKKLARHPQ